MPAAAAGLSWFLYPDHNAYPINKNTRQTLAYYVAVYRPANAVLCSHHLAGARSFRPFVPHSRLSCAARTPRYSVDKFATRLSFFLAAGAITFFTHSIFNHLALIYPVLFISIFISYHCQKIIKL